MFSTTNIERTPASMRSRMTKGRTERRILVAGRWQRTPESQALIGVFGREAASALSQRERHAWEAATTLRSLLA